MAINDLPTRKLLDDYTGSAGEGGLIPIPGINLGFFLQDDGTWVDIQQPAASETVAGIMETATTAEVDTGTDSGRAVSPSSLAGSALATTVAANAIMNSTRMLSGGLISVHERNIGSISGDGNPTNLVTVDVTPEIHNLSNGDDIIVSGTVAFDETTQQTITVTGASTFTYSTTTHTATGPEVIGTISANSFFEVGAGIAEFIDHATSITSPPSSRVAFGPFLAQSVTNIASQPFTAISVNSSGSLVQQFVISNEDRRTTPVIGLVIHPDLTTIQMVNPDQIQPSPVAVDLTVSDLASAIGNINFSGNVYSPNGVNMSLDKSSGSLFVLGGNRHNNILDPNVVQMTGSTPMTLNAIWRVSSVDNTAVVSSDGPTTTITAGFYDAGTGPGTPAASPSGVVPNNSWVIHRLYMTAQGATILQYGQVLYSMLSDALASINTETFQRPAGFDAQLIRAYIIVRGGATDLSSAADGACVEANRFGF